MSLSASDFAQSFQHLREKLQQLALPKEEQDFWLKQLKSIERALAMANFKFERMEREKKSLENLLESTISELNEKNQNLLELNASLIATEEELRQNSEELRVLNEMLEDRIKAAIFETEMQANTIKKKNIHITDSINYAKRIQEAMLWKEEEIKQLFPESFVFFRPKDVVSGDFYWFADLETKTEETDKRQEKESEKALAVVADCTGHGVPGAFMSLIINDGLNQIVKVRGIHAPAEILKLLDLHVKSTLRQEGTLNRDGADVGVCLVDKSAKKITFAGAKSNALIIQNAQVQVFKGTNLSVGGDIGGYKLRQKVEFENYTLPFQIGKTLIYLYSDGYKDQFGGKDDKKLSGRNFRKLLEKNQALPLAEQGRRLESYFVEWKQKREQLDDVLVVGLKV
ncbi:SpoIIE family protein phosphatase [Hugenholtzia roseola]|uniref:SpoIIE family protein phosphatase n=1 Tax=Hugenholtzia roseola TaxID=1002 RepID=UPI0012B5D734|nr:SpoIIE family protein phosphatase [Hugenholtzia roseola]